MTENVIELALLSEPFAFRREGAVEIRERKNLAITINYLLAKLPL